MNRSMLASPLGAGAILFAASMTWSAFAAEMLSGAEIASTIPGNTVQGSMADGTAYSDFYQADGTLRGKDYQGKWMIEGDAVCFEFEGTPKACWQMSREGDEFQWLKEGAVDGTGTLLPGNPNNF